MIKKLTFSAVSAAVLAVGAVGILTRNASAAEPKARFISMKKAVLASMKKSGDELSQIELQLKKKPDGTLGSWIVVDGELTELQSGDSKTLTTANGKTIQTQVLDTTQVGDLPPELQKEVQKAIDEATKNGSAGTSKVIASVNGQAVDPSKINDLLNPYGLSFKLTVDLNENDYRSISFGKDQDTLVLIPKKNKDQRYTVMLDSKSSLPKSVLLEQLKRSKWTKVRQSAVSVPSTK